MEDERQLANQAVTGIVLRLRHERMRLQAQIDRIDAAMKILNTEEEEIPIKQIENGRVVTVEASRDGDRKTVRRRTGTGGSKAGGTTGAIRMAIVTIGPATTADILAFITKKGIEAKSSTVSAILCIGRKQGEYRRDSEGRWSYTGGVISHRGGRG